MKLFSASMLYASIAIVSVMMIVAVTANYGYGKVERWEMERVK